LKKDWNPTQWSLYNILEVVKCLLIVPFPESSLNEQAGKLIMENYEEYFKHAKLITSLYATPKELKTLENVSNPSRRTQSRIRRASRRRSQNR
jgi:ubiquitin-conjugating enzyme E2 S